MLQKSGSNLKSGSVDISSWKYYSNAIIPATPPDEPPVLSKAIKKELFRLYPKALFIRWYSDFDCVEETHWWYLIKDSSYNVEEMKAKRRYEIIKGRRNFETKVISSKEFKESICDVWIQSLRGYSERDRSSVNPDALIKQISSWDDSGHLTVIGSFYRETSQLCGFSLVAKQESAIHISSLKTIPEYEKYALNAALVDGILLEFNSLIEQGCYVCDGSRNVLHETRFQDYLVKYFNFRKAYCRLYICYRGLVGVFVKILYLFRKFLKRLDHKALIHKINGVLTLEDYKEKHSLRHD